MDSNHIHIFLEKILATAQCPQCKKKTTVQDISIQNATEKSCIFSIHCSECGLDSLAQAVINVVPEKNTPLVPPLAPGSISSEEIAQIKELLQNKDKANFASFLSDL